MMIKKLITASAIALFMGSGVAWAEGDATAGKAKADVCSGCHGAAGMGDENNPALAGLDAAYQVEQLAAYKSGDREHAMMQMFASQLSDEDMADLAAYYSTLGQ